MADVLEATQEKKMAAMRTALKPLGVDDEEEFRRYVAAIWSQVELLKAEMSVSPPPPPPPPTEVESIPFFAEAMYSEVPETKARVAAWVKEGRILYGVINNERQEDTA